MTGLRQQAAANAVWDERADKKGRHAASPWARPNGSDPKRTMLVRAIETEVIPRLILSRRAALRHAAVLEAEHPLPECGSIEEFAGLTFAADGFAAAAFVEAARDRGASVEALYLDLMAPAARHLGQLWEDDVCDFTDVTIGLGRLQQILRRLSPAFLGECEDFRRGRRALLMPLPGEQHTFGLLMVAEFLRRAGWEVWSGALNGQGDVAGLVRRKWFAVAGLSLSTEVQIDGLARCIRGIRRASKNRQIGVMVGGPLFIQHPELVAQVGADVTATDGRQAVLLAEDLLALLPGSP